MIFCLAKRGEAFEASLVWCELGLLVGVDWWGGSPLVCDGGEMDLAVAVGVLIAGFLCLWKGVGGHDVGLTLPFSSHLPHQPVIHPVCELNECNEACYPYLYTQEHTPSHTNIPWQTKLPLPPPILPLHLLPSGVLFVYPCVYFCICLCVRLCVVEHAFLLSLENNRQG